ncbi:hypothetical protein CRG98_020954 [Punica granatum]|uniref:RNase H type-1 domain-containing protein n=1 Tax=Punica granatum TaxID=22663 RepID=A0A2I0JQQ3_PUNGR|nr:hypothetical protein CRG98_020954 [Punica granatum]
MGSDLIGELRPRASGQWDRLHPLILDLTSKNPIVGFSKIRGWGNLAAQLHPPPSWGGSTRGTPNPTPGVAGAGGFVRYQLGRSLGGFACNIEIVTSVSAEVWAVKTGLNIHSILDLKLLGVTGAFLA